MRLKKYITSSLITGALFFGGCTPHEHALVAGVATGVIVASAYQPYYYNHGRYYHGGYYSRGYYHYQGNRYRGGHYYNNGYRYYNGRRYKANRGYSQKRHSHTRY